MTDAGVINRRARVPAADLERLIGMFHADPHSILGAHAGPDGVTIRVFRPEAKQISVIDDEDRSWPMTRSDARGLFEVLIPNRGDVFRYQLRIVEAAGNVLTIRDAYAFLPTIGSLDLHLWNEGRHLQIYEKLGAHFHEIEGASGFTFAVWAPNARSISVVGDFNDWDGRIHMMRSLGTSGVWEIFIPGVAAGARYKFEIRTRSGDLLLKADPFAAATEAPPATASITYQSS
jgi:1,4-alpha-glucan branching enzyme